MQKLLLILAVFTSTTVVLAQDEEASLGSKIDDLTYDWDLKADDLDEYANFSRFCTESEYRGEIITLLEDLHHFDSVLFDRLSKASRFSHDKEIEKTLKDIEKFEKNYDINSFLSFLREECVRRKDLEEDAKELKNDIGANSYDGQIYLIETELNKYIKHITKRVDNIRKHVHHLNIN